MLKKLVLLAAICAFADETPTPFFTGSLIAPIGDAVPYGDIEIDAYNYFIADTAIYDGNWKTQDTPNFYTYTSQPIGYFGLTSWMNIQIIPEFSLNWTEGARSAGFNDLYVALDFQFRPSDAEGWLPGFKLSIGEVFPTGKYQNLSASKLGTDEMGLGAYTTYISAVFYKIYHISGIHFLSMTLTGEYGISSEVEVHGLSAWGGGIGTKGKVQPGNSFLGILSFEYSMTQHWNLALDTVWSHQDFSSFFGYEGTEPDGTPSAVGDSSNENLSFAPAIEYGFTENLGIVGGCWFSAIGRNSTQFQSGVINFYYYY